MNYYKSASEIQESLLSYMPDGYNKIKGCWLWDILKACACGLSDITADIENVANKMYADALQGDELEDYVKNWSYIEKKKMTQATGYVTFYAKEGKMGTISEGTYVSNGTSKYITSEDGAITSAGGNVTIPVVAAEYGSAGNCEADMINKMITSVEFIEKCNNYNAITGGEDTESDESLLKRYKEAMKRQAYAGNMAYYEEIAKSIDGVGNAYCIACPNGVAGTVWVYVTNNENKPVTESVLGEVQAIIDPNKNGDGIGAAPVGAIVTVKNPLVLGISIEFTAVFENGYSSENIMAELKERLGDYFKEAFEDKILRYNQIGKCILDTAGVKDFKNLKVNNDTEDMENGNSAFVFTLENISIL